MGFCHFNNVAIAARQLQEVHKAKRIMILDWDIHQGNGTQKEFYDDDSVLFISLHRYENATFFPSQVTSGPAYIGSGPGVGRSINIPWPCAGMTDADYMHAFHRLV